MLRQFTPEKVIRMIKLSVTLCCCWPLPAASSRIRVCGYKVLQIFTVISACLVLLPLLYSTYLHSYDIVIVSKCICVSIGMSQLIVQTLICLIKHDSLQVSATSSDLFMWNILRRITVSLILGWYYGSLSFFVV